MADESNVSEVFDALDAWLDAFSFTLPGHQQSLGRDVGYLVAEQIEGRNAQCVAPDGSAWKPNDPVYAAYKDKKYGYSEISRRTSQMLSHQSLAARISVQPDTVTLTYGTGQPPSVSKAPSGALTRSDRAVSDVQKALFATSAGRAFFGVGAGDLEAVTAVCKESLDKHVSDFNKGQ